MPDPRLIPAMSPKADPGMMLRIGHFRLTVLTPSLIRVEEDPEDRFCDEATQSVWFRRLEKTDFTSAVSGDAAVLRVTTSEAEYTLDTRAGTVCVKLPNGRNVCLSPEHAPHALPGTCRTLDGCDGLTRIGYTKEGDVRTSPVILGDAIVSRDGAGLFDDSASLILGSDGVLHPRVPEKDWYVFAHGSDYRRAVKDLYLITGFPPVVPRFALGNWWSRYHAYTDHEYLDLMDSFFDQDLPFTVATVDMDWHLVHDLPRGEDGWTGYTWNRDLFPDPDRFLQALHERNMHVTLNLHPALGVRFYEEAYPEMARRMGMDPKEEKPVEFDFTDHRFIDAYFSVLHHPMEDKGVDFWWIDWQQGTRSRMEGLDPLWSLNHYHYLDSRRHPEALILSRYAGIGSHRYPVGFSGDTFISWETMKIMPLFTSSAANTGFGWWSHDIGGHMQGVKDNELYLRFVQFGVFSPVSRLHGTSHPLLHKEPEFFGNGTGLIAARFLRLRHAMIPMLHSASIRMSDTGLQLIEPMYYAWPEDENAYQAPGQYLFGQTMIAAPVTSPLGPDGLCVQHVYLPEGRWTDVFTGQEYRGGWHDMARDLDSFPLLARSGSFFVQDGTRRPHEQENLTDLPASLRVLIFSGNGSYSLLEDAPGFTHRAVTTWNIREDGAWQELTIDVEDPDSFLPGRSMDLEFRNVREAEVTAFAGNMPLDVRSRSISLGTLVHVPDVRAGERVTIRIREKSSPWQKHLFRLADTLSRLEMDNTQKDMLYRRLLSCTNPLDAEGTLSVHPVQDAFRTAIMECFADGAEMDETDALPN